VRQPALSVLRVHMVVGKEGIVGEDGDWWQAATALS
jgi:hypothetical protein